MSDEENDNVNSEEENNEEENNEENEEENNDENEEENNENENEEKEENEEEEAEGEGEGKEEEVEDDKTNEKKKFELLAPIAESKIEIIGAKNNSSIFNKSLFNMEDNFNKRNKKKNLLSVLSEINKDLDSLKNDLTDKKIIGQYKPRSIKPSNRRDIYRNDEDEYEKSTISDMKFTNRKVPERLASTKNKKLQVEIEKYNKNNETLSRKIELLNKKIDKSERDSERDLIKDFERSFEKKEYKKQQSREVPNEKVRGQKNEYIDPNNILLDNDRETSPKRNKNFNYTSNNTHRHYNNNDFHRTYTKNLDNNHYRTIEDLYKRSPKAPVYYSRENSKNKKVNNYKELSNILNRKYPDSEKIRVDENYGNLNQNRYESDYGKNKHKYNISNAMNILLDKGKN